MSFREMKRHQLPGYIEKHDYPVNNRSKWPGYRARNPVLRAARGETDWPKYCRRAEDSATDEDPGTHSDNDSTSGDSDSDSGSDHSPPLRGRTLPSLQPADFDRALDEEKEAQDSENEDIKEDETSENEEACFEQPRAGNPARGSPPKVPASAVRAATNASVGPSHLSETNCHRAREKAAPSVQSRRDTKKGRECAALVKATASSPRPAPKSAQGHTKHINATDAGHRPANRPRPAAQSAPPALAAETSPIPDSAFVAAGTVEALRRAANRRGNPSEVVFHKTAPCARRGGQKDGIPWSSVDRVIRSAGPIAARPCKTCKPGG